MINYQKTNWVDGETLVNAENLNKIEKGIESVSKQALSLSDLTGGNGIKIDGTETEDGKMGIKLSINPSEIANSLFQPLSIEDITEDFTPDTSKFYLVYEGSKIVKIILFGNSYVLD